MHTKLTLTIEKEVIEIAKEYAKDKGQSLSEMVENYLKLITSKSSKPNENQFSSKMKNLKGIIKADHDFDYKQVLTAELSKKHDA
jgi:hypothetical protein